MLNGKKVAVAKQDRQPSHQAFQNIAQLSREEQESPWYVCNQGDITGFESPVLETSTRVHCLISKVCFYVYDKSLFDRSRIPQPIYFNIQASKL